MTPLEGNILVVYTANWGIICHLPPWEPKTTIENARKSSLKKITKKVFQLPTSNHLRVVRGDG